MSLAPESAASIANTHPPPPLLPSCYTPPGEHAMTIVRPDGRQPDQLRSVRITPKYLPHAEGSALIELGNTTVGGTGRR